MGLLIFYLLFALFVSFLCSVMEAVLLSTPLSYLSMRENEGEKRATKFKYFKQHIDRPLSAILSLNTIAHTVGAAGVGAQAEKVFGDAYFGVISAVLTILILFFSEIVPKTIGARYWKVWVLHSGGIISFMIWLTYPLVFLSELITNLFSGKKHEQSVSREEVSAMLSMGTEDGVFENEESKTIQNLIGSHTVKVKDIMTPRIVSTIADCEMLLSDFFARRETFQHSRIPVYAESPENIIGYVRKSRVFECLAEGNTQMKLKDICRDIVVVPENQSLSTLWELMLGGKEQIAMVVDEYGSFEGIATIEDIVESMLGLEILDEKDTVVDMQAYAREKWRERSGSQNDTK